MFWNYCYNCYKLRMATNSTHIPYTHIMKVFKYSIAWNSIYMNKLWKLIILYYDQSCYKHTTYHGILSTRLTRSSEVILGYLQIYQVCINSQWAHLTAYHQTNYQNYCSCISACAVWKAVPVCSCPACVFPPVWIPALSFETPVRGELFL